jgi:hypothetical protein
MQTQCEAAERSGSGGEPDGGAAPTKEEPV